MSTTFRSLPLFPLDVVLYPREQRALHIFEERYKKMIDYCLSEEAAFGIVKSEDGEMADVGCTARVRRVLDRHDDGRLDILVQGEERFHLLDVYEREAYLTADAETIEEPDEPPPSDLLERVITQHMKLLEIAGRKVRPSAYEDVGTLSYTLAQNAGLSLDQKQEVLELLTERERIAYLVDHLQRLLPRLGEQETMRRRIQSNGHFPDFFSSEE